MPSLPKPPSGKKPPPAEVGVLVKRLPHFEGLELPAYATDGAAGMDVLAAEDMTLVPGGRHAVATGLAQHRIFEPRLGLHEVQEARAFRAQCAAIGRMVGVALDVDDLGLLTLRKVALGIHDDAASHGAVRARVAGFCKACELEGADRRCVSALNISKPERT